MIGAGLKKIAGRGPAVAGRVPQLAAGKCACAGRGPASHQHLAVEQRDRGVESPRPAQAGGQAPVVAGRVVALDAGQRLTALRRADPAHGQRLATI